MPSYSIRNVNMDSINCDNYLSTLLQVLIVLVVYVLILKYAWNKTMTTVFNLREIDFVDAFLLIVVMHILFN